MRWWCLALIVLAGCAAPGDEGLPDDASTAQATPASPMEDPWHGLDRILVARQEWGADTFSLDLLCIFGGEWYVPRNGEPVRPGTAAFEVTVDTGPLYTGLQVGLQYRDEEILWLDAVSNERRTFTVKILPEQWESDGHEAWTFWYRDIVNGNPELCYTGVAFGERTVDIEAVRG